MKLISNELDMFMNYYFLINIKLIILFIYLIKANERPFELAKTGMEVHDLLMNT